MGGQRKDHHLISTTTKDYQLVGTESKHQALTPLPNMTLWQSLRSYIQAFAEDHPKIYAGIIILVAIALASLFVLPIMATAGRPQPSRTCEEFDPSPNPTPLTRWSPPRQHNELTPEFLPNAMSPNITLTTLPSTTTVLTTTSPGQNHTKPHHRPSLSPLDFSNIAVGSTFALALILLASNSAYKHYKIRCSNLGKNLLSLHRDRASIQNDEDEETPLNPTAIEERRACLDC